MKRWKIVILLTCLIPLLLVVLLFTFNWVGNFLFNKPEQIKFWHEKVKIVFDDVKAGFTKEQALEVVRAHNWPENMIYVKDTQLKLFTADEFPSKNWLVIFEFEDGKLISAKVRKEANPDSPYKPVDAPNDIVYSRENADRETKH